MLYHTPSMHRLSHYFSPYPLYCVDWAYRDQLDLVALSTYKEGLINKLHILTGSPYGFESTSVEDWLASVSPSRASFCSLPLALRLPTTYQSSLSLRGTVLRESQPYDDTPRDDDLLHMDEPRASPQRRLPSQLQSDAMRMAYDDPHNFPRQLASNRAYELGAYSEERSPFDSKFAAVGYDFACVAELNVDYPVTKLKWDPRPIARGGVQRLASSLDVLRLYKLDHLAFQMGDVSQTLVQTHLLANGTSTGSPQTYGATSKTQANVLPPVTSFDWNVVDPNIIITSSVDTTCTVWDLNRSPLATNDDAQSAVIKTQLIAHDSEVFDVKFLHKSRDIFASVGNDGLMRVFDLRSLEHSTIIYERDAHPGQANPLWDPLRPPRSKALIKLDVSNANEHHIAALEVNSNQVLIIDMRSAGHPVAVIDASLNGANRAPLNLIQWHPSANYLLTGGDDCQAHVWDCTHLPFPKSPPSSSLTAGVPKPMHAIDMPLYTFEEELEVNNACWRRSDGDWIGVVSGRSFQAVRL